jgi:two-component system chemotaxis response regulator CheB
LAERLDTISEIAVKEAAAHDRIRAGQVYIAPGNYHMIVQPNGAGREIVLNQDPPLASHRPAVDVMFDSVAQFGKDVISVIMTGMGCDGSAGMRKIKSAGGYIIAENEETSVVYGMPKAVVDMGIADEVLPLQDIARSIVEAVKK